MKQKDKKKKKKKRAKKKSKKKSKERAKEEKTKEEVLPGPSLEQWQKESLEDAGPGNAGCALRLKPGHARVAPGKVACVDCRLRDPPGVREAGLCSGRSSWGSSLLPATEPHSGTRL